MIFKKFRIIFFTLFLMLYTFSYNTVYAFPDVNAKSYIVIDADSGRILDQRNSQEQLPIASTTKILTAILAIESVDNINQKIEIPADCTGIEGSSIYLRPGQMVSIKDLLYGTMLRSGNDAAATLAKFAGEKYEGGFIQMMNDKAKELGALNSNFTNPHGLHNDNHYSTAYDLALISSYAMKNDTFKEISSAQKYKAESMNNMFYNKNKVVHDYKYGNGIKIGFTKAAGRCLVASAEKDNTEVIVVVLNDGNWFNDSYNLFDWAFENYKNYQIAEKGQFAGRTKTGEPVFISETFTYLLKEEEINKISLKTNITIPHVINNKESSICGTYSVYLEDEIIYTGNLVSEIR